MLIFIKFSFNLLCVVILNIIDNFVYYQFVFTIEITSCIAASKSTEINIKNVSIAI